MATQDTKNPIMGDSIISPGFKSAAAMAGWDEEALLASLVVEDTPIRESRHSKRPKFKSSSNSKRKRRLRRQSTDPIPALVLCLDDEEGGDAKKDNILETKETKDAVVEEEVQKKNKEVDSTEKDSSNKGIACMDKLKEELSCAICLDICFEPSTTPCGHSFCMKCLKHAASKCGKKCPKCRQLISNARACTVNTVLWNTIQLLFPDDIEARKNAVSTKSDSPEPANPRTQTSRNTRIMPRSSTNFITAAQTQTTRNRSTMPRSSNFTTAALVISAIERDIESSVSRRRRRAVPTQNQDAELALRLQREEYMEAQSSEIGNSRRRSIDSARANLRAMASSRYHIHTRARY